MAAMSKFLATSTSQGLRAVIDLWPGLSVPQNAGSVERGVANGGGLLRGVLLQQGLKSTHHVREAGAPFLEIWES